MIFPSNFKFTIFFFFLFLCSTTMFSATITWDGGGGDGEWTTASNWDGNVLPSSSDDVVIDLNDEVTLSSGTHTVKSIELKESSRLIISSGVVLNINVNNNSTVGISTTGNTILTNNGTINITDGFNNLNLLGRLNNNAGAVIYGTSASQTGIFSADKGFYNYGTISMDGAGSTNFSINSQSYNYASGQLISTNSGWAGISIPSNFDNYGIISDDNSNKQSINLTGGSTTITNHFGGSISSTNALTQAIFIGNSAYFNNEGNVTVSNATGLSFQNFNLFTNAGNLQGTGTFDLGGADLGGTVIPGTSPGSISFSADQTFLASSTLEIEVDGTAPGTEHDQISVAGTATISGTLATTINYTPVSSDRIVILTAATISGTFGTISPALAADWALDYSIPGEVALVFGGILPVELTHFSAKAMDTSVQLEWQTASEINNEGFEIHHSDDGIDWIKIGFVPGHDDSELVNNYHFQHKQAKQGLNYYRLKQMDFDGIFEFSKVEVVEFNKNEISIQVFPNPVARILNIKIEGTDKSSTYELFDISGKLRLKGQLLTGVLNSISIIDLPNGHYLIKVKSSNKDQKASLIIQK